MLRTCSTVVCLKIKPKGEDIRKRTYTKTIDTDGSVVKARGTGVKGLGGGGQKGGGKGDLCNSVNNKIFLKLDIGKKCKPPKIIC